MKNYLKKTGIAGLSLGTFLYNLLCPLAAKSVDFGETVRGENSGTEERSDEGGQREGNLRYGGNLTAFYAPIESTIGYPLEEGSINTKYKGELFGGNIYVVLFNNGKLKLIGVGNYSNMNRDLSNSANSDLGSVETQRFGGEVLAQIINGKLVLEPSVGYEYQTTTTRINPLNADLEETVSDISLALRGRYNLSKGDLKYGPIAGVEANISDIQQERVHRNVTTIDGEAGFFVEGDNLEATVTLDYDQVYDIESDSTLSGLSISPEVRLGGNTYVYAGGEVSVSDNEINRKLYLIGVGQEKLFGKLPFGLRVLYFDNTEGYDNGITETDTSENGVILSFVMNDRSGPLSALSPRKLLPKTR